MTPLQEAIRIIQHAYEVLDGEYPECIREEDYPIFKQIEEFLERYHKSNENIQ